MAVTVEKYKSNAKNGMKRSTSIINNVSSHAKSMEHVGSTSVNGLAAKPIIDIDIIKDQKQINLCINSLEKLGYRHRGNLWRRGKRSFL